MAHSRSIARPLLALALAPLALAAPSAQAQTAHDEQAWLNLTAMGPVSGDAVYFVEFQPRLADGISRIDQAIVRGAIGWKLAPGVTVYQGYGHVFIPIEGGRDANEERSFQQLNLALGKPWQGELSSRTRLEQRWRSDGRDTGWRLREMVRYERPFRAEDEKVKALVSAEAFFALNDTDWGARGGFDQLRSFAGVELALSGQSTAELGYLNQLVNQSGGRTRMNHVASISLFYRH